MVQFAETEEVEAVPLSWLRSDDKETLCSWPPYPAKATTRIMTAISERTRPGDGWPEYQATIIKKCGQFNFCTAFCNVLKLLNLELTFFCTIFLKPMHCGSTCELSLLMFTAQHKIFVFLFHASEEF